MLFRQVLRKSNSAALIQTKQPHYRKKQLQIYKNTRWYTLTYIQVFGNGNALDALQFSISICFHVKQASNLKSSDQRRARYHRSFGYVDKVAQFVDNDSVFQFCIIFVALQNSRNLLKLEPFFLQQKMQSRQFPELCRFGWQLTCCIWTFEVRDPI